MCDRHKFLLVVDEVQTGMGRTGKLYAFEHWGIQPDIICWPRASPRHAAGGIIASEKVMDWPPGSHASTFGGNPVSCRAALATLNSCATATWPTPRTGEQLKAGLLRLAGRHAIIGTWRGLGLMVAADVVQAGARKAHDHDGRDELVQARSIAVCCCWAAARAAIRFCPPLCVSAEQVETR